MSTWDNVLQINGKSIVVMHFILTKESHQVTKNQVTMSSYYIYYLNARNFKYTWQQNTK